MSLQQSEPVAPQARPLRRDAERNRQRILAAAARVTAERGLEVTMDDIAEAAGVGVGTVYRRYPDKQHLIDALFEERIDRVTGAAREAVAHPDPWQGLVGFLEDSLAEEAGNQGLAELLRTDTGGCAGVRRAREQLAPVVAELVGRAQAAGLVRADLAPADIAVMKIMLLSVADHTRDVAPDAWRRYFSLFVDSIRPQPAGTPALAEPPLEADQVRAAFVSLRSRRREAATSCPGLVLGAEP
jgi:AcrR family transcriptional regulator